MSVSTTVDDTTPSQPPQEQAHTAFAVNWQSLLFYLVAFAFLALGLWLRLKDLGLPFDRDGYDEGVYWQSLRAMATGHSLYQQIFYSQPPFFLLSIYPIYTLFGQTLWSARLGIAVISLFGLIGAFLLGKAMSGRLGALAAMVLLLVDPFYLSQSQRIQAEAPSAALSLLSVGLAYMWWENPEGWAGITFGSLAGITLSLSILSKLLGIAALVPLGLLMLAQLWRIFREQRSERLVYSRSLIAGVVGFLLASVVVLLPFVGAHREFIQGVITFHTDAGTLFKATQTDNLLKMQNLLTSPTAYIALFSTIVALARRDWRVIPLLAWLGATVYMLWLQTPLFHHHLVALIPPLVSLAIVGIGPLKWDMKVSSILQNGATGVTLLALLFVMYTNWQGEQLYYSAARIQNNSVAIQQEHKVAMDVQNATAPGQLVITDDQFAVALANRDTPPSLVDTSIVRINTSYVTLQQLEQAAAQPQVHAVLFYTGRLRIASVSDFRVWLAKSGQFHLLHRYGDNRELWVRI